MHDDVLNAPVLSFADVQLVLAHAVDLVSPVELSLLFPGSSEPAEHFPVEIILVDLTARVGAVEELLPLRIRRRNADRPRRPDIADDTNRIEIRVEHLNT